MNDEHQTESAAAQAPGEPSRPQSAPVKPSHRWRNTVLAVLLLLLVAGMAPGQVFNTLGAVALLAVVAAIVTRLWGARKGQLELGLLRSPFAPHLRWYRIQLAIRAAFILGFVVCSLPTLAIVTVVEEGADTVLAVMVAGITLLWLALELIPTRRINIATNVAFALGVAAMAGLGLLTLLPAAEGAVTLTPPFRVPFVVIQGGESLVHNHHYLYGGQRHALDILALEDGLAQRPDATGLAKTVCYGQPLLAPATGTVVKARDDIGDELPMMERLNTIEGNAIVIAIADDKYVMLAHLKQGSLLVKEGDEVAAGQPIAACGNSGVSSMPHLHIQVQNSAEFQSAGNRTFPIRFGTTARTRYGETLAADAPVARGDVLTPALAGPSAQETLGTH